MKKFISKTLLGLIITLAGIGLAYFYFDGSESGNPIFLVVSAILIIGGLYFLSRVVKQNSMYNLATEIDKPMLEDTPKTANKEGFQSMLDKNNAMVADYAKTSKTRDQLKVLEIAGAAEEAK